VGVPELNRDIRDAMATSAGIADAPHEEARVKKAGSAVPGQLSGSRADLRLLPFGYSTHAEWRTTSGYLHDVPGLP
jgi:hypothetical protein